MPTALSAGRMVGHSKDTRVAVGVSRCRAAGCGPRLLVPASPCGSGWALGDRPLTRLACVSARARFCRADRNPDASGCAPRTTAGWRAPPEPCEHPNRSASAHNSQPRELNSFRLYKRLRMWCVESLISPPRHTQSGTVTASQLDNKENTFSGDVRMCRMSASTPPLPIPARHTTALQTVTSVYLRAPALLDVDDVYRARRPEAGVRRFRQ